MKQFGRPVRSRPDLFDMVVMAVVVAFMLTLAAQVSAAPIARQAGEQDGPVLFCGGMSLLTHARFDERTRRHSRVARHQ